LFLRRKKMEELKRQKGEHQDHLTARIIRERAKGRCEFTWYEKDEVEAKRCRELHGEPALGFQGYVQLILMPIRDLKDTRLANQRAVCQRHAYQILSSLGQGVQYRPKKKAKGDSFAEQTMMEM
jgi:hypothetical protein